MNKAPHKRIAKIVSTQLGFEDHGIFTSVLNVVYDSSAEHQGIGGFALTHTAGSWIVKVLRACGVDEWSRLVGRTIFVLLEDDSWSATPVGIENLPTERGERFIFKDWQDEQKAHYPVQATTV